MNLRRGIPYTRHWLDVSSVIIIHGPQIEAYVGSCPVLYRFLYVGQTIDGYLRGV